MSLMRCQCLLAVAAVPLYYNFGANSRNLMAVHGVHTLNRSGVVVASYVDCIDHMMQSVDLSPLFQWLLLKLCAASVCEIDFVVLQLHRMTLAVVHVASAKCIRRPLQAIDISIHALAMSCPG